MTSTPRRLALVGLAASGILVFAPAAAQAAQAAVSADASHTTTWISADARGAVLHIRKTYVGRDGRVRVKHSIYRAGPDGSLVRHLRATTG
ncbi:hypothetical protein GCM10023085_01780 [Actinomadura viridis]|uniref:Uncharacterized protein n=1 Tax=Actinomadura viridis TaxID=58110 RepID=A0A931DQS2_9ACTN|nr:hypothetical protein [Actinomadura viridis]MBG6090998.1 hypothetical protein [Actinomadura viridis]